MKPQAVEFLLFLAPSLAVGHKHNVRNYPLCGVLPGCLIIGHILSHKDMKFSLLVQNELFCFHGSTAPSRSEPPHC